MKVVARFSELEDQHGLPSLENSRGQLRADIAERVAGYLRGGVPIEDCMEAVSDPLAGKKQSELRNKELLLGGPSVLTDGEWFWRQDLAYFVENYRVGLPGEFIEKALHTEVPEPPEDVRSWYFKMISSGLSHQKS